MGSYTTKLNLYKPDVDEVGWAATVNANMGVLDDSALTNAAHTITGAWTFSTHPLSLDHTQISNIGANTHVQIDTHLADTTIHFTEANIDHGSIAGLTDDDHTQYAHLLGRNGGQSLAGDTASGGHLTLVSTTHGTKGRIKFGASGNSWYDEATDNLHIRGPVIDVKTFGVIGDGVTDDTTAIQAANDSIGANGGVLFFPPGTYIITEGVLIDNNKTVVRGAGIDLSIIKVADSAGNFVNNGVLKIAADSVTVEDITLDGNSDNNTAEDHSGILASAGIDNLIVRNSHIKNTPKAGIFLFATSTPNQYINIHHNFLTNIGWDGITVWYAIDSAITDNTVISSGNTAIYYHYGTSIGSHYSRNSIINNNKINRAVPPTTILTGQTETGFMIHPGTASEDITIAINTCFDNRNSSFDGIGSGNHLTNPSKRIMVLGNTVTLAGLYGIDVAVDGTVSGNRIDRSARHGIALVLDLGGTSSGALITNNTVSNSNEENYTISDITGILIRSLVAGAVLNHIIITNNNVYDDRGTQRMDYAVEIDSINATIVDLSMANNDFKEALTGSIKLSGTDFTNLQVHDNILKTPIASITDGDTTPSVLGAEKLITGNTTAKTITALDDGYNSQVVDILFGDANTTIDFTGTNLKGNSGVDWSPVVGDSMRCIFDGTDWLCTVSRFTGAGAGDLLANGTIPLTDNWEAGPFNINCEEMSWTKAAASGSSPNFLSFKARGSIGSEAVVQASDNTLLIQGYGYDGDEYVNSARIMFRIDGTPGNDDMPGLISFWTTPDGSATLTERMVIDSSGNVGIGQSSPTQLIEAFNDTARNATFHITNDYASDAFQTIVKMTDKSSGGTSSTGGFFYKAHDTLAQAFFGFSADDATFHMAIQRTGRIGIGIGSTIPSAQLHIDQNSATGAIPTLYLDQADVSEEMIEFNTTIGVGNAIEAVGAKSLTTTHFIKVTLSGGLTRYIPCGTIA